MNKKIFGVILLMICSFTYAQQEDILGKISKQDILKSNHYSWYSENYKSYKPQPKSIDNLNELLNNSDFEIEVYFGSWCSDSQRELPRLIKLLEYTKFNFDNLKLVGVGRDKIVPGISQKQREQLNVTNVPTIIVYEDGQEINRFVEYAQESLEKDMIKILSKQNYKHSYQY